MNIAKLIIECLRSAVCGHAIDKSLFDDTGKQTWSPFSQNLKETYITDQILSDLRKIEAMFDTDIGIPSANTDKRERLITDEVNANNVEIQANIKLWKQNVEDCCKRVNKMFPEAQLKITFPYYKDAESVNRPEPKEEGGEDNEPN